jgi:hypothetical protein
MDNDLVEVEVSGYSKTVGSSFRSNVVILTQSQSNQVIRLISRMENNFPGPLVSERQNQFGGYEFILEWAEIPGYLQELWEDQDNRSWQKVQLASPDSRQYVIPTTGEVSMIRFRLVATSLDGCDTAESMRVQYTY